MKFAEELGIDVDIAWLDDRELSLEKIHVPLDRRRKGLASQFMQIFCERCDDHGITIHVYPTPFEGNISQHDLEEFYARFGFLIDEGGYMIR